MSKKIEKHPQLSRKEKEFQDLLQKYFDLTQDEKIPLSKIRTLASQIRHSITQKTILKAAVTLKPNPFSLPLSRTPPPPIVIPNPLFLFITENQNVISIKLFNQFFDEIFGNFFVEMATKKLLEGEYKQDMAQQIVDFSRQMAKTENESQTLVLNFPAEKTKTIVASKPEIFASHKNDPLSETECFFEIVEFVSQKIPETGFDQKNVSSIIKDRRWQMAMQQIPGHKNSQRAEQDNQDSETTLLRLKINTLIPNHEKQDLLARATTTHATLVLLKKTLTRNQLHLGIVIAHGLECKIYHDMDISFPPIDDALSHDEIFLLRSRIILNVLEKTEVSLESIHDIQFFTQTEWEKKENLRANIKEKIKVKIKEKIVSLIEDIADNTPETIYMREISKIKLLSAEEEIAFARKIKEGDDEAKKLFIKANLQLVMQIARTYMGQGLDFPDCIQAGNLGLMHAVEKFDPERGFRFSTYATNWIKDSIYRAVMDQSATIRTPIYRQKETIAILKTQETLRKKLGREPTMQEIATEMGISVDEIWRLLDEKNLLRCASLDAPIGKNDDGSLLDVIANPNALSPETATLAAEQETLFQECLSELTEQEQEVLARRFGLNGYKEHTREEIAEEMMTTLPKVRTLEKNARNKLFKMFKQKGVDPSVLFE